MNKRRKNHSISGRLFLLFVTFLFIEPIVRSQDLDSTMEKIYSMDIEELMNVKVTIATKSNQPVNETPSVVSVITSEEIKNMGARELEDVLQMIPGFEITKRYNGYYGIGIRGVKASRSSNKLLLLVDGVPYNQIFYGFSVRTGYTFNIDAIERIEIIRGPGSALYGRNAFSAVINIITKNGKTDDKPFVKVSGGSFNTKEASGYYGYKKNKFNFSIAASGANTDGTDVKFDDGYGGTALWNIYHKNYSFNTNINYGNLAFSGSYLDLNNGATLNKDYLINKIGNYSLAFNKAISPKLSFNVKIYGHNEKSIEDLEQYRNDLNVPIPSQMGGNGTITFADLWPLGLYYKPEFKEYLYGAGTEINYRILFNNNLLFGAQTDFYGVKDVKISANISDFITYKALPGIGRENEVLYQPGWFENNGHNYRNIAFYAQDIWYPFKSLGLTFGARYDFDSEIGKEINPRAGIVFQPLKQFSLKLLYGKAYRAPAPSEQFATLGFAIGNRNLKPEVINTFEFAIIHQLDYMTNSVSIFKNDLTNLIDAAILTSVTPNNKYYNIGKNSSKGIEYENKIVLGKGIYSFFNYSYTVSKNTDSINGEIAVYQQQDVAPHKINLGVNYSFLNHFNINLNMFYRNKMKKFTVISYMTDVKDGIGDFAVLNSSFRVNNIIKGLNFYFSVYNALDKTYYSQDNGHLNQPRQPGRQILFGIDYYFK